MSDEQTPSVELLRMFAPLDGMKRENLAALAKKMQVRTLSTGRALFTQGDSDKRTLWLVSGVVELNDGTRNLGVLRGGTPEARNPLDPHNPRRVSVRAVDDVRYLAIDGDLLDVMITWDQTGNYEVGELQSQLQSAGSDDWMTTLLQTNAFHRIRRPTSRRSSSACSACRAVPAMSSSSRAAKATISTSSSAASAR
jgi:CRP-like cAMP-binding protein